jgi:hypothetical protein
MPSAKELAEQPPPRMTLVAVVVDVVMTSALLVAGVITYPFVHFNAALATATAETFPTTLTVKWMLAAQSRELQYDHVHPMSDADRDRIEAYNLMEQAKVSDKYGRHAEAEELRRRAAELMKKREW